MSAGAVAPNDPPTCHAGCRRHAAFRPAAAGTAFLAAAVAALSVAAVPFDAGESLCGMWGCVPPLPPLVAMHLLWAVGLAAAVWAVREWWPALLRPAGRPVLAVAAPATALSPGLDLAGWLRRTPDEAARPWPRRAAYALAAHPDRPLLQSLAAGSACLRLGRRHPAPVPLTLGDESWS